MIEELNVRSLEDLLVSEEVAEEKDEGTTIKIREGFTPENKNFGQKNDRSLTEVLTEKNYDKVLPIIKYLPFRNCVPVKDELINIHFLCIKLHFSE